MLIPLAAGCVGLVAGCNFPSKTPMVSRQQVNQVRHIEYGTVQKTDVVVVAGQNTVLGTYGGGATGAAAAGDVGHGVGTDLARVGGAVVGAVAGQAVEEVVTRKSGLMMTIKLENGGTVVVTQEAPPVFNVGDRVAVISGPGGAQVTLP
jgi:outer membrane lipoprotein SlyB